MIDVSFAPGELRALKAKHIEKGIAGAMRKAASTSARDMRSEASKRVRARKKLKVKAVNKALSVRKNRVRNIDDMAWGVDVRGATMRVSDYPHRQLIKRGVKVEINRGTKTLLAGAFTATMPNGHKGVYLRRGAKRLPLKDLVASRPVDSLNYGNESERVAIRGKESFDKTMGRILKAELERGSG